MQGHHSVPGLTELLQPWEPLPLQSLQDHGQASILGQVLAQDQLPLCLHSFHDTYTLKRYYQDTTALISEAVAQFINSATLKVGPIPGNGALNPLHLNVCMIPRAP